MTAGRAARAVPLPHPPRPDDNARTMTTPPGLPDPLHRLPPRDDPARAARVQQRLDGKTKPLGALGRVEGLAAQLATALRSDAPRLQAPQLIVFAADHGLARHGVSAYPAKVTPQMVRRRRRRRRQALAVEVGHDHAKARVLLADQGDGGVRV